MRLLDRALTSPHRLAIFDGGHVWLSSELAIEAVEWMELQAMKSGAQAARRWPRSIECWHETLGGQSRRATVDKKTLSRLAGARCRFRGAERCLGARRREPLALGRDKSVRDGAEEGHRRLTTANRGCSTMSGRSRARLDLRRLRAAWTLAGPSSDDGRSSRRDRRSPRILPSVVSRGACSPT